MLRLASRAALLLGLSATAALGADSDGDGLDDGWERLYFNNLAALPAQDPDGDGLSNGEEHALGSDPTRFDSDGDGLSDGRERDLRTSPTLVDSDSDGLSDYAETQVHRTNPRRRDTDGGGRDDGEEVVIDGTNPLRADDDLLDSDGDGLTNQRELEIGTDPFSVDTDGDLLGDREEDANGDGRHRGDANENGIFEPELGEETDPTNPDTDGDGLSDGLEKLYGTDPFRDDSDGDGLLDGVEHDLSIDEHLCLTPARADSDGDGVPDGVELTSGSNPCNPDSDGDGVLDGVELSDGTNPAVPGDALADTDGDGLSDNYETTVSLTDPALADSDGDGLNDGEEVFPLRDRLQTSPFDADSDDDGLLDGSESVVSGDSIVAVSNPLLADTDGDGLLDGLERGLSVPEVSALDPDATDLGVFVADTDPSTTTNPREPDTDGDTLLDGAEDQNHDGLRQANETDPNLFDTDGDGMSDGWELDQNGKGTCGTAFDPTVNDSAADFDADGLSNHAESTLRVRLNLTVELRPTDPCDPDTDDDGLSDAVEAQSAYGNGQTDPTNADTDGDGIDDGVEDANLNGRVAAGVETDPTNSDSDGDGLRDGIEDANRNGVRDEGETDPRAADSDGDGLGDGTEVLRLGTDPLNTDTDGDGLSDGRELGLDGDADPASRTDPLAVDTDFDGLSDGEEDTNLNGRFDAGETNPTDRDTDDGSVSDGREVQIDGTDPNDPRDDIVNPREEPPVIPPLIPNDGGPELPPDLEPGLDPRWLLEANGEIRGTGCALGFVGQSAAQGAAGKGAGGGAALAWLAAGAMLAALSRRGRGAARLSALGLGLLAASARPAQAQTPDQIANARNTNIDANPHRINPGGFELLGVSRPRVLPHLGLRGAASISHLTGPAVVADRDTGDTLRKLVANRQQLELGVAFGLLDRFQIALMAPAVLHQRAELPGQDLGTATSSGFGNPTIVPRAVLLEHASSGFALGVEAPVTLPLWDPPAYMGYDGLGVEPRLLTEVKAGPIVVSTAVGALFKEEQRIFNLRDGNELTYGVTTLYPDAISGWDFAAEFQGATPLSEPGRRTETRGEVLLGARHRLDESFSVSTGGGAGLLGGIGQSGYRVFLAVGYAASLAASAPPPPAEPADNKARCMPRLDGSIPPGCPPPDADGDGILDRPDQCTYQPEDKDGFQDEDGCPDPDNDEDGLKDEEDGCPNEAEDRDGYKDADGCPEPDNDSDGVLDVNDECPFEPEDQPGEGADGCPEVMAKLCPDGARPTPEGECLARIDAGLIQISEPVQFGEYTANLADASRALLNQVVDILDANPDLKVTIVGHTDSWGPRAKNLQLSKERARAVRLYLIRQSKEPSRMAKRLRSVGKGESEPIESNDTAVGRARNRRVEFVIVNR